MKKLYTAFCLFLFVSISLSSFGQATNAPLPPTLSNASSNSITVGITSDGNPANTEYSIYCATTGQYVQANGSLGASEVKQTAATWGNVVVTGLSVSTNYCFYATAYDGNNPITGTGTQILSTETFSTNSNFSTSSSAPTSVFWSPATCTNGGLIYTASGGCTDGYVGKTGNWTNFFGCFLRTPAINCSGQDSVVLNLDITHSYFANQVTGDKIRFYMWIDGGYEKASSIKIAGQEVGYSDLNGLWLRFTEARSCVNVSVTFDLSTASSTSSVLFYMEANNGYNNSNTFDVKLDNISMAGGVPTTACLSTTGGCNPVDVTADPADAAACDGDDTSFDITATGDIAGYQWQVDAGGGNWVDLSNTLYFNGVNTTTLSVSGVDASINGSMYRCIVTSTCSGPDTSEVATLTVNLLPNVVFNPADTFFCVSDPAYDMSTMISPTGGAMVGNGVVSTSFHPALAGPGTYDIYYEYYDSNTGCFNRDSSIFVVQGPPTGVGTLTGPSSTCEDEGPILTFTYTQANSQFAWTYPSGWTGTADSNVAVANLLPDASGTVSVAEYNSCGSGPASSVSVTVHPRPTASVVVGGASFAASGGVAYDWLDCDSNYVHVGSTSSVFHPSDFYRRYAVIVIDQNGCTDTSDCVQLLTVGMDDPQAEPISIYPNPADDYTIVTLNGRYAGGAINVYDASGRMVQSLNITSEMEQVKIDMSELSKGLYSLQLIAKDGDVRSFRVSH